MNFLYQDGSIQFPIDDQVGIVDVQDMDILIYNWYINDKGRLQSSIGYLDQIVAYRAYPQISPLIEVIHYNKNPLDCRRNNIAYIYTSSTTGVYFNFKRNIWITAIPIGGTRKYKEFKTEEEAVKYRKEWEDEYFS